MKTRRRGRKYRAKHLDDFSSNMAEVHRLLEIHGTIAGDTAGRKYRVAVLNKSGIVLLVACWEACMEDLVCAAFDILLKNATDHNAFPAKVRAQASAGLRESKDASQVWQLAGNGWRSVMSAHRKTIFGRYAGKLNTPRPAQIDQMFESMLGLNSVSDSWHWHQMDPGKARTRLNELVTLRGSIAHRVATVQAVHKAAVERYAEFVTRLAIVTHNQVHQFLEGRLGFGPWHLYEVRQDGNATYPVPSD